MPDAAAFLDAPPAPAKPAAQSAAGFLDAPAPAPPAAPAPKAAPQEAHSFLGAVADRFLEVPAAFAAGGRQANENLKHDFTAPLNKKRGMMALPARAAKTALDAVSYPFANLSGAVNNMVSEPVKKLTKPLGHSASEFLGNLASDAAMMAQPEAELSAASKATEAAIKAGDLTSGAVKPVQRIFSPATVSDEARAAAKIHRAAYGTHTAEADRTAARLAQHQKAVGNLPVDQQRQIVAAVESPKTVKAPEHLQPVVEDLQKTAQHYRKQIEYVMARNGKALPSFIEDYYVHMWKEKPSVVTEKMGGFVKQGSGRNLKARSIPTLQDGIDAGLTPRFENPVDATTAYAANMSRFLATHDIQADMKDAGLFKMFPPGAAPKGWVPLKGMLSSKTTAVIDRTTGKPRAITMQAYAPEDAARIYNNNISKGLDQGDIGPIFRGARAAANATSQMVLGLSGYHATATAIRGTASEVGRAVRQFGRGDFKAGSETLAKAPASGVRTAMSGAKFKQMVLNHTTLGEADAKIVNAYVKSGQRLRMDDIYRAHAARTFFDSALRGTFKRDLQDSLGALYKGPALERAKGAASLVGNVIGSAAAPIFEKYVPAMKQGVFYDGMQDFLKANPNATEAEQIKYATQLGDTIDNRFGEMVQDNLFWHKATWQVAQLTLLSPSWQLGTIRDIGGGVREVPASIKAALAGKSVTDKTAYLAGLAATTLTMNAVYQYLKTGKPPQGYDWLAPQTGGKNPDGSPERIIMPGEQKDVISFLYDFPHHIEPEIVGKLQPALKEAYELANNTDYKGQRIYRPEGAAPIPGEKGVGSYLAKENSPIGVKQMMDKPKGSHISGLEALAGINKAPSYEQNPEKAAANRKKYANRDWRRKVRTDQREANQ